MIVRAQAILGLVLTGFLFTGILIVFQECYSNPRGARDYLLGELRGEGLLTEEANDLWWRAEKDSLSTSRVATFTVRRDEFERMEQAAAAWLGPPMVALGLESRSIAESGVRTFDLPQRISPLPLWGRESLLVFGDADPWIYGHLLILARDHRRVWYFRYSPER